MRKALISALGLVLALTQIAGVAQAQVISSKGFTLFRNYDVASASYIYGTFSDDPTDNFSPIDETGIGVSVPVKTTASSTTVAAVTASSAPFLYPAVGDMLIFVLPFTANNLYRFPVAATGAGERVERVITAHASNDSVTVDSAVDLGTSLTFHWKRFVSGTAATNGWFPVKSFKGLNVVATVGTINATSLDFAVDCMGPNGIPNQVFTKNFTSATYPNNTTAVAIALEYAQYSYCRAGWKINTDTGVQSVNVSAHLVQ